MPRLTLFRERLNLVNEPKSTILMEGDCSTQGPHVAQKMLTVIISATLLHYFISVTLLVVTVKVVGNEG